jgi:hypothetical protein
MATAAKLLAELAGKEFQPARQLAAYAADSGRLSRNNAGGKGLSRLRTGLLSFGATDCAAPKRPNGTVAADLQSRVTNHRSPLPILPYGRGSVIPR